MMIGSIIMGPEVAMALDMLKRWTQGLGLGRGESRVVSWRTPAILDRGALGEACLALDGQGRGLAVWDNAGSLWSMPVGPRTSPALLRTPFGEGGTPQLVMNAEGRGLALWVARMEGEWQILGRTLGTGEDSAQVIHRTPEAVRHLQGAVDRRGNALVVWLQRSGDGEQVMAQAFDTRAAAWEQSPTALGAPGGVGASPRMAVNHREHAMVVWEVQDDLFQGLVASHHWPNEHLWSDRPVPVVAHATHQHRVAMDDQGNAMALWIRPFQGERSVLESSHYEVQRGEWTEPQILATAPLLSHPQLGSSGDGLGCAAWCQSEGHGPARLMVREFRSGAWDAQATCLDQGHAPIREVALEMEARGSAGVLAIRETATGDQVVAWHLDGSWSQPRCFTPALRTRCTAPRLALCPGGASALWMQGEGADRALVMTETT